MGENLYNDINSNHDEDVNSSRQEDDLSEKPHPKVLADRLKGAAMDIKTVTVELRPYAKKHKVSYTAKERTIHYRSKTQTLIQDFLQQGIIEEAR